MAFSFYCWCWEIQCHSYSWSYDATCFYSLSPAEAFKIISLFLILWNFIIKVPPLITDDVWYILCCTFGGDFQSRNLFCIEIFLAIYLRTSLTTLSLLSLEVLFIGYKIAWVNFLLSYYFSCVIINLFLVFLSGRIPQFLLKLFKNKICYHSFNSKNQFLLFDYFILITFCLCFISIVFSLISLKMYIIIPLKLSSPLCVFLNS